VRDHDGQVLTLELVTVISAIDIGPPDALTGECFDLVDLAGERVTASSSRF
jgi:hypothetical protein